MGWPNTLVNPVIVSDALGNPQQEAEWVQRDYTTHEIFISSFQISGNYDLGITKYAADQSIEARATIDLLNNGTYKGSGFNFNNWFGIAPGGSYLFRQYRGIEGESGSHNLWQVLNRSDLSYHASCSAAGMWWGDNPNQTAVSMDESKAVALNYNGSTGHYTLLSVYDAGTNTSNATDLYTVLGNQSAYDVFFDGAGALYVAVYNGNLAQFSISGTAPTLVRTFTPFSDGIGIYKLTYRPTADELILWYRNGRVARWSVGSAALTGSVFTLSGGLPGDNVTPQEFSSDRSVATDDTVFCSMYGGIASPYVSTIDVITGAQKTYLTSLWSGFNGTNGSRGSTTYEPSTNSFWMSRLGNSGFVVGSLLDSNGHVYTRIFGNLFLP